MSKSKKPVWQAVSPQWLVLFVLGLCAVSVSAQSTSGNIVGTIYDSTGATVPNASIVARNIATGVEASTISTSSGQYRIANLPIGAYSLSITAGGFAPAQIANIPVVLNQTVTSNTTLELQKTSTTVVLNEAGAPIDTTTAQVQTTFDSRQMQDLSIASGTSGVINLSLLNAGVASSGGVGYGNGPSVGGSVLLITISPSRELTTIRRAPPGRW